MISPLHFALILFVVINWGLSFVVIHFGLVGVPPLLLAALRFAVAAWPLVWVIARPKRVSWVWLAGYGIFTGVIQFGVAFTAINIGITSGLASLVIQMNAFFTVLLSSVFFKENLLWNQWIGLAIAFTGIALIGTTRDSSATLLGLGLILIAALGWAGANLIVKHVAKQHQGINLFAFAVHGNAYAPLPLLLLSLLLEGPALDWSALTQLSWVSISSVVYLGWVATVICFGAWAFLIGKYSAGLIAPFSLLVPVFGMGFSAWLLGEAFSPAKLLAAGLVVLGLLVNTFGSRVANKWRRS